MEPFRKRVEPSNDLQGEVQVTPVETTELKGYEDKARDPLTAEEQKLEIWEGLHNRKYVTEYFDIKNIEGEFNLKMQTSVIDKYIKGELEKRGYEKNTENWEKILDEIEAEIGSRPLELYKRITKLTGYIKAIQRLAEAKKKAELYRGV